jgi:CBS domain containing-hemolysin-like protein
MDTLLQLTLVLVAFMLVGLNGFFVASEFSIVKVRATRIEELLKLGDRRAGRARKLINQMDEYLSATQLGITVASLGLGWIGEPAFAELIRPLFDGMGVLQPVVSHTLAVVLAFLLITFLHIVLGELAPKSLAIQKAEAVVLRISAPMDWFYRISYPLIWSLNGTAIFLLKVAGLRPASSDDRAHSEEELRLILAHSVKKGVLDLDESQILERVLEFGDRSVKQVMVPSMEVVFLNTSLSLEQNLAIAHEHEHTRYPLCAGTLESVLGVVHVKDLFLRYVQQGLTFDLMSVKREVQFVPDSKLIKNLLAEFRRTRTHLAIVVNEHGSTVGMVTLEDVLEEIVGEIEDEFDIEAVKPMIQRKEDGSYLVHGRTLLDELQEELLLRFQDEENETIAGHVMMLLGRAAQLGDQVQLQDRFWVTVVGTKGLQITDLLLEPISGGGGREAGKE